MGKFNLHYPSFLKGVEVGRRLKNKRLTGEPVAYLYNGMRLIPLPEWDKETYPYAVMYYDKDLVDYGAAYLILSSAPLSYKYVSTPFSQAGHKLYALKPGSSIVYIHNIVYGEPTKEWEFSEGRSVVSFDTDEQVFSISSAGTTRPHWANYDLTKHTDGSVYIKASEPVPVYE